MQNPFLPQMGAWYLLALFSYRLVLPELSKIKGIMFVAVLLTVFTCVLTGIGSEFALKKFFGFLVYFMSGYFAPSLERKMPKKVARIALVVICVIVVLSTRVIDYSIALSVLSRSATIEAFSSWYYAPIIYFGVFVATSLVCILVMNAIPDKCGWLEKQGTDTMPMYISHLILFMAIGYLVDKGNRWIAIGISIGAMIISLWLFSRVWYRTIFNKVLYFSRRIIKET